MDYTDILHEIRGGAAWITINRPDKYNAFRGQTCEELIHAFQQAGWNRSIGVIVLTGALNPARFQGSDAVFNIGCAVGAVQTLGEGVWIAMNGRVWDPAHVRKNRKANRFEPA